MSSVISSDFFNNTFELHPDGNKAFNKLYCNEYDFIIKFHDEIWKFLHYKDNNQNNKNISVYINKDGEHLEIDIRNQRYVKRMQICS